MALGSRDAVVARALVVSVVLIGSCAGIGARERRPATARPAAVIRRAAAPTVSPGHPEATGAQGRADSFLVHMPSQAIELRTPSAARTLVELAEGVLYDPALELLWIRNDAQLSVLDLRKSSAAPQSVARDVPAAIKWSSTPRPRYAVRTDPPSRGALRSRTELASLFLLLLVPLTCGATYAGVCWDEVTYFDFADHVRDWWRTGASLSDAALTQAWGYDRYLNPHPPMMRAFSALTAALGILPFPANYRLATLLLCAGLLTGVYRLLCNALGMRDALLCVAAIVLQPRVYGDILNATTDAPVALAFLVLILLAWSIAEAPYDQRTRLRVVLYAVYGMVTAIKFTGLLALAPVGAYWLWRRQWKELLWSAGAVPYALTFLVLTSPDRWHHPVAGIVEYLTYPFRRSSIPISAYYLGQSYPFHLPWHYFDVMTTVTLPLPIVLGLPLAWLTPLRHRSLSTAIAFPIAFWVALAHLPSTPRHDGVRQFLAVMPLLGVIATLGYLAVVERTLRFVPEARAMLWSNGLVAAAAFSLALSFAPWVSLPLSSYNELVGGLEGAERRGLEISYFLEAISPSFLTRVNAGLSAGDTLALLPPWDALLLRYQREGVLRADVRVASSSAPRYLLLVRRRSIVRDEVYAQLTPLLEVRHGNVSVAKFVKIRP
jgi:hypothetical protein